MSLSLSASNLLPAEHVPEPDCCRRASADAIFLFDVNHRSEKNSQLPSQSCLHMAAFQTDRERLAHTVNVGPATRMRGGGVVEVLRGLILTFEDRSFKAGVGK